MNSLCTQPLFLRILYISGRILNILRFVIPIILIIRVGIDIYYRIINPDDKDGLNKIKTRIIAAIMIFLTPTIIGIVYGLIEKNIVNNEYSDMTICREFANLKTIESLEKAYEQEQLDLYLDEKQQNLNARERYLASIKQFNKSLSAATEVGEYANNTNMIKCGSGSSYNTGLFNAVRTAGYKTRNGVVAAALYLSSHIDAHIPYFWSGGHLHEYNGYKDYGDNFIGVSDKWGCEFNAPSYSTSNVQKPGTSWPFGMDCSGFVHWAIVNGGYYTGTTDDSLVPSTGATVFKSIGHISVPSVKTANARGQIKAGDIAFKKGHVGLVVDYNDDKYIVAEEQSTKSGLVIREYSYDGGKGFSDIVLMDNFYNNYKKGEPLWNGFK